MSKNADGWVRHRGGKCPVDAGVKVDYRMRNGSIDDFGRKPETLDWAHYSEIGDIMAYKLHKPAEQGEPFIEAVHAFNALAKFPRLDGPLQWRDRITTIDFDIHALTTERAELVQKLASEGFALIGRVEDMSDWRNWKVGDVLEMIGAKNWVNVTNGRLYKLVDPVKGGFSIVDDVGESRDFENGRKEYFSTDFKFHSRPST